MTTPTMIGVQFCDCKILLRPLADKVTRSSLCCHLADHCRGDT
ncbi:hypothetical protein PT273_03655 [Orbaceae bacterium ESL0727]|nr:hypothetical protein [Orbaceae bacterium ESL0727]